MTERLPLWDARGHIIRSAEVLAYLQDLVDREPAIAQVTDATRLALQEWGQTGIHFVTHLTATGEPALLKVNVGPDQLWWSRQLAHHAPELIPRVYASGAQLGPEPVGWILWEQVQGGLHPGWQGREFDMILEAGVRFQVAARGLAADAQRAGVLHRLTAERLAADLERGIARAAPGPAEQVLSRLHDDWAWIRDVCQEEICHGDLHMANALCRQRPPQGHALLIDYHPTRMPWVCEPAKPEILNAEPGRLGVRGLVKKQAAIRSRMGLSSPSVPDLNRAQAIVLGWWAIQSWAHIGAQPNPSWRSPQVWYDENLTYIRAAAAT